MVELRAGFGRAEITPPVGIDLTGFIARENPSESVRDPLFARALVLEVGESRVLLVSLDCLGLDAVLGEKLRGRLARETWIPTEGIALLCSHSHSGPATVKLLGCGEMDLAYLRTGFRKGILEATSRALENIQPAKARWGKVDAAEWHEYRRRQDRGPSDADLVDHTVRALWLDAESGDPMGCFWTFAAHPTILAAKEISGDWVGVAARRIEEATPSIAVYGQGCSGDVGPILQDNRSEAVERMGEGIGERVIDLCGTGEEIPIDAVAASATTLEIPFQRAPKPAWFAEYACEMRIEAESHPPGVARRYAGALADWAAHWATEEAPQTLPVQLQGIRLGPVGLALLPFEPLSGVGHAIREACGPETVVLGYANACHSYLAPASQYMSGGYEINEAYRFYDLPAPWETNAAEIVVEAVAKLIRQENSLQTEEPKHVD
jgi:neutral ceramidase